MKALKPIQIAFAVFITLFYACNGSSTAGKKREKEIKDSTGTPIAQSLPIDTADYKRRMNDLANGDTTGLWPANAPISLPGAILPYHRIVAFYGNMYSK